MRAITRLYKKAKEYKKQGDGRKMAFVCRNYIPALGGKWECLIDTIRTGRPPEREEAYFDTQEEATLYAESKTTESDWIIIDNI